jgi:hypothetical protein
MPDALSEIRCPPGHKMPQEMPGVAAAGGLVGARLARLLHREEAPLVAATRPDLWTREGNITTQRWGVGGGRKPGGYKEMSSILAE